jgi:hypothetical protein
MKNELFKSVVVNKSSLFSPHAHSSAMHKRSRLGLYEPIMTKESAVNKLTNDRAGSYKKAIKEKEQLVNVLQRKKEKKERYKGSTTIIDSQIQPLLAEIETLKLKQQQLDSGRQELLHYVLSQRGGIVPSEKILSFIGGKVPLPTRTIAPDIPPEGLPIDAPTMGGANFLPVNQPEITNIESESEAGASIPPAPPSIASMQYSTDEDINHSTYVPPESKYSFVKTGETEPEEVSSDIGNSSSGEENTEPEPQEPKGDETDAENLREIMESMKPKPETETLPVPPPPPKTEPPTPRSGKNLKSGAFVDIPKKSDFFKDIKNEKRERRNKRARELYAQRRQDKGQSYTPRK